MCIRDRRRAARAAAACVRLSARRAPRPPLRPRRLRAQVAGTPGDEGQGGGARVKRESAPAVEGAPASSKLRAPRKKCSSCQAFNPTAQQACQACGARFVIKSKAKQQSRANKEREQHGAALGGLSGLQLPLGTPLALGALTSALAAGGVHRPAALSALGAADAPHSLENGARGLGPHMMLWPDGRSQFHDAQSSGAPLDLQAILQASSVLTSTGAPITSAGVDAAGGSPAGRTPATDTAAPDSAGGPLALPHAAPWSGGPSPACVPLSDTFPGSESDPVEGRFPGLIAASGSAQPSMSSAPLGGLLNSH